jgi:hypothetical protein
MAANAKIIIYSTSTKKNPGWEPGLKRAIVARRGRYICPKFL